MTALKAGCIFQAVFFLVVAESAATGKLGQLRKITVVSMGMTDTVIPQLRGLYDGLGEVGYVEGKNLNIDHLGHAGNEAQVRDLLKAMVRQGTEVIVTPSSAEANLAKQVTSEVPIVFAPAVDPVGNGLVKSRANPGTNLTGLSYTRDVEDNGKQLAVFKQIVPGLRRVMLFYDGRPVTRTSPAVLSSLERVARSLDIRLTQHAVNSSSEALQILQRLPSGMIDGVFLVCSAVFRGMRPLSEMAASKRLPVFSCTASQVAEEGTLMTYTPDMYYLGYRGAWYVDRILKGAKPAQLRVETPMRFELVINISNARRIGLVIPSEALMLADKVFH
ncbi:MAG TPA: ABC transporter substrate-binding protein [Candidatus Binatia bacterium]|nr:ABC transporter substrate-binding protein [Candidatus Binatia bacterium]